MVGISGPYGPEVSKKPHIMKPLNMTVEYRVWFCGYGARRTPQFTNNPMFVFTGVVGRGLSPKLAYEDWLKGMCAAAIRHS